MQILFAGLVLIFAGQMDAMEASIRAEFYKDTHNEWRWRIQAGNNRILADSGEGYKNKKDCEDGLNLIKQWAVKNASNPNQLPIPVHPEVIQSGGRGHDLGPDSNGIRCLFGTSLPHQRSRCSRKIHNCR